MIRSSLSTSSPIFFVERKITDQFDGVWTTGTVQCLHQGILYSMTCMLPGNSILTNKSQSFSIVWADDTDSICDLSCLLTYFHPPLLSNNLLSLLTRLLRMHRLLLQEFLLSFTLGDLVDVFTRSGSFAFLSDLFDTERLFELPDYRVARVIPKGEDVEPFVVSMYLVLDLTDKYPHDYLTTHFVEQFLPELFTPCSRRVRVRQIVSNAKRFQSGEWKGLWETTLCFAR